MSECDECAGHCPHGMCISTSNGCVCTTPEPKDMSETTAALVISFTALFCVLALVVALACLCDCSAVDRGADMLLKPEDELNEELELEEEAWEEEDRAESEISQELMP